jgi:BirA family biotin operon repressor/biotin-[acetyl-CoA-carboxylase] ligase
MIDTNKIIKLQEVDSTNEYMKRLYVDGQVLNGLVVVAESQMEGKGQVGKMWESDKGKNLLFTLFLKPEDSFQLGGETKQSKEQFSFAVSVSVLQLVKEILPRHEVTIKWPNDVLVEGEKIAGILIENRFRGGDFEGCFIGVGLNVNQTKFPRFTRLACSLKSILGYDVNVGELPSKLQQLILLNVKSDTAVIKIQYESVLYKSGQEIPFLYKGKQELFTITTVDEEGRLVVKTKIGEELNLAMGEIKYLI